MTRVLALATGLVLLGVVAAAGGAATQMRSARPVSDARIVATVFTVAAARTGGAAVACPSGTRVVGGGVGQTGSVDPHEVVVMQSGPLAEDGTTADLKTGDVARYWYGAVFVLSDGGSREVRVFAICSKSSDVTAVVTAFTVDPGRSVGGSATCPGNERVVGGGVGQTGAITGVPFALEQSGPLNETGTTAATKTGDVARSWYGAVFVESDDVSRDVRVVALCSKSSDATIAATTISVDGHKVGQAAVKCPPGTRVVGGGIGQTGSVDSYFAEIGQSGPLNASGTTASTKTGDVAVYWYAAVWNAFFGGAAREFHVFALCANDVAATKPRLTVSGFSVGKARAGNPFTVSFTVDSSGKGVKGALSCSAKLNGKTFGASHDSVSRNGVASCAWSLPRSSSGERLTGSIAESYKGARVSRSFSVRVA